MNPLENPRIKSLIIDRNDSVLSALKKMDGTNRKLLLVFDDVVFHGLLSIGDIQSSIIRKVPLESPINDILRSKIRVAHPWEKESEILALMKEFRTECMPIVDADNKLVDVWFWDEKFSDTWENGGQRLDVPVVIMAGGFGSRLKPLTNIIPKPLVPIGDKPIVEIIIDRFNKLGATKFYLSVNYKHEMIRYYFDHLENRNYRIEYIKEDQPLGTAGSIYLLKDVLSTTFFVSNCDILIDQDYREIYNYHLQNRNEITLVGSLKHFRIPYGTLETGEEGKLISMKEKPEITYMINSGMYVLEPSVLADIPDNSFFHITDLIEKVKNRGGNVGVFPVSEKSWLDIGEWNEYQQTLKTFEDRLKKS